jgi:RNA polymerase sigma-70 factor (ECF subfamily)
VTNNRLKGRERFMLDDAQLLIALRQRDPAAFAQLFELYSDKVYRLALGLLEDENEAEGVVQDAFMRLLEHLDQFEGRSKLGTWLYRVAYNLSIDQLRKRQQLLSLVDEGDYESIPMPSVLTDWREVPETWLDSSELSAELDRAIASLPAKLKTVFILREIEGCSTAECSQILAISESAAKVRLHRARLLLRERLAEYVKELV